MILENERKKELFLTENKNFFSFCVFQIHCNVQQPRRCEPAFSRWRGLCDSWSEKKCLRIYLKAQLISDTIRAELSLIWNIFCTWKALSWQKMHRKTFSRKFDSIQRHVVVQKATLKNLKNLKFFYFWLSLLISISKFHLKNESENVSALDFVIVPFFGPVLEHVTSYFSYRWLEVSKNCK